MTDAWNCPHIAGDDGSVGRQPEGRLAGVPHEFTPRQRLSPCAAEPTLTAVGQLKADLSRPPRKVERLLLQRPVVRRSVQAATLRPPQAIIARVMARQHFSTGWSMNLRAAAQHRLGSCYLPHAEDRPRRVKELTQDAYEPSTLHVVTITWVGLGLCQLTIFSHDASNAPGEAEGHRLAASKIGGIPVQSAKTQGVHCTFPDVVHSSLTVND